MAARIECGRYAEHDSARGGRRHADAERNRRDAIDVDPDQLGRRPVQHRGTDRSAERGAVENKEHHAQDPEAKHKAEDVYVRDAEAADWKARRVVPGFELHVVGAEEVAEESFDAQGQRIGHQH